MAKHIPGPWKVGYRLMNVVATNAKIGGDAPICDIRGWGYLTGKGHGALGLDQNEAEAIQTANANLIAAAPDMLEALKACAENLASLGWHPAEQVARAAIAKAEGAE